MFEILRKVVVARDFDFLLGAWRVDNRRLVARLQGSNEWESFKSRQEYAPLSRGIGITGQHIAADGTPTGMSVRFFNYELQQWHIHWISYTENVTAPPLTGTFANCLGIFEGDDVLEGKAIRVRFVWSAINTATPHWEQSFSADNGRTWEKNWVMDFTRIIPRVSFKF